MWALGLVLERHHFLARLRHQTLRHHVRVVGRDGLQLRLRHQVREHGALRRRQRQVSHAAQIEFADAARNVVVQMVLHEPRGPTHRRVSLEGARVVVVGVQVVLTRPSGQGVEAAVHRVHGVQLRWRWSPEEVDLLSLSGDLGRRHGDRDQSQVVGRLRSVVPVHHHELRWLMLLLLRLVLRRLLLLQLILATEPPQPNHQLGLDEAEAHRDDGHAEENVPRGDVLGGCTLGLQVAGADCAEGGEAEVEALQDGPALDLVEEHGAQGDVADEDDYTQGNRHGWHGRRRGRHGRGGGRGAAAIPIATIYKSPVCLVLVVVLLELFAGLVRVHVIPVAPFLQVELLLRVGVAVFFRFLGRPRAALGALATR